MFGNFGRIFFQAALIGCFFKEKMLLETNKNVFCNYCQFQEILRRDICHLGMKYSYEKYYLAYAGIPLWTSGIPTSRDWMWNVPASFKRNNKFMKK